MLAGGIAALAAGGIGYWGRFALGKTFETHVAETLGFDLALVEQVLENMRNALDDYEARATAFLVATAGPARLLMPESLRREAIEPFLGPFFASSFGMPALAYAGLRDEVNFTPCVLVKQA
jgi:hypothetical protein